MKRLIAIAALALALQMTGTRLASAQYQYLGEVRLFAFTFCPVDWMQASGQILQIAQYAPLYTLYGTLYGGDGRTTFGLPNLNGRAPYGSGTGGQPLGAVYGNSTVTLTINNLPAHTHAFNGTTNPRSGPTRRARCRRRLRTPTIRSIPPPARRRTWRWATPSA
jgi:microcystin-dependent protein